MPQTLNLDFFNIPNFLDIPAIDAVLIEQPDPVGPFGAKALGKPPLVPVAGAIANAVYDAVAHTSKSNAVDPAVRTKCLG